ncbi:MAG: hypothetical protein ACUVUC_14300 [Thermoguttaceae bacterium]
MSETLQEFVSSRGVAIRVDRAASVIRGVKILGLESRNGRTYLPEALAQAAALYEDARVNVNHPKGDPLAPRDYQDRIGAIRNVVFRPGEGLFGDFHFNPKHALAEQLVWDAEHAPDSVGFSHNVEARTRRSGQGVVVEAILRVQSVDLVADPATSRGLFEAAGPGRSDASVAGPEQPVGILEDLTLERLKQSRPDLVRALGEEQAAELGRLQARLDELEAAEALRRKHASVRQLLQEFKLPDPETAQGWARSLVSPRFLEALLAAPTQEAMRELVRERAELVRSAVAWRSAAGLGDVLPRCREQQLDSAAITDLKEFVKAISG